MPKESISTSPKTTEESALHPSHSRMIHRRMAGMIFWLLKATAFGALAVIVALTISLYVQFWPGEILVSFLPQAMIGLVGGGMVYATIVLWIIIYNGLASFLKRFGHMPRYALMISGVLGSYLLFVSSHLLAPTLPSQPSINGDGQRLRISTFNKLFSNHNIEKDSYFMQTNLPHIMGFQEVVANEIDYVADTMSYEYRYTSDCECSARDTELGLVSKFPIVYAETEHYQNNSAILHARLQVAEEETIAVFVVHMGVPVANKNLAVRKEAYDHLAGLISNERNQSFVMGDFNTTVFSPQLRSFLGELTEHKLVYERRWPECSWYGFGDIGCVRIDHIIVPRTARLHEIKIGDDGFSDHRPIFVDLTL